MNNRRVVNGINTVVLHGKDYVEVAERLRIVYELKKDLEIVESQPYQYADRWVWRVVATVDGKRFVGNAEVKLANAMKGSPDATNPFECAETSALGRALAFAGLGTVESIASYDEIARGQPFVSVVETSPQQVVEAENGHMPRLSAPQQSSNRTDKSRLNALYTKAQETGAIEKGLSKQEGAAAFLEWAGKVLEANVASVGQLTASRLDMLDAFLVARSLGWLSPEGQEKGLV